MKYLLRYLLIMMLGLSPVGANGAGIKFMGAREVISTGSEYMLRNYPDEPLMTIHVLGAIGKPGIYHVPETTDLLTLMSLTGGGKVRADLERVILRKRKNDEVKHVNLKELISTKGAYPDPLHNGDVLYVNPKDPAIDKNTILVLTVTSIILGIISTSIAIRDTN